MLTALEGLQYSYNQATETSFGSSAMSTLERKALLGLYAEVVKELAVEGMLTIDKATNRKLIRKKITSKIITLGWPRIATGVEMSDLGETAVAHACTVAESLLKERGVDATPNTVWSYTSKDQFDRFVAKRLLRTGRINKDGDLFQDWYTPIDRKEGHVGSRVNYPSEVDSTKIYGIGKPARYWPAQLMRNLESLRLGYASEDEVKKLGFIGINPDRLDIPWSRFAVIIQNAGSVEDIAVGIALKVMNILKLHKINDDRIICLIVASYNPKGMIEEHGDIPEIFSLWDKLLRAVAMDRDLLSLHQRLKAGVTGALKRTGSSFHYMDDDTNVRT